MTVGRLGSVRKDLEILFTAGAVGDLADGELLERFVARRDEAAFETLVRRHGPMVLRVCRGVLADPHDAQDAFQATFLVLVRRAGAIRKRDSVASWLFGVAGRVAARARADAARRRRHEHAAAGRAARSCNAEDVDRIDPGPLLYEEVARLPEKYRAVVVLCDLEGQTYESAARRLGRPIGTIKVRLSRARGFLRDRLARRGIGPSDVGLVTGAAQLSAPPTLMRATFELASRTADGKLAVAGSAAVNLAAALGRSMMMTRFLSAGSLLLVAAVLSPALGLATGAIGGDGGVRPTAASGSGAQERASSRTPRELYERLVREYEDAQQECHRALRAAQTPEETEEAQKKDPDEAEFTRRFLLLAQGHPGDPVAVDAINWPFTIGCMDIGPLAEKAVDLLIKDHLPRGRFGPTCRDLAFIANRNAERLFHAALEKCDDREVRGWSCFGLAQCLRIEIERGRHADPERAFEEAERLYRKAAEEYGDLAYSRGLWPNIARRTAEAAMVSGVVESGRNTLADLAGIKLAVHRARRDLVVGKPAYEIEGADVHGKPMKLGDHRGRVVVLIFAVSGDRPFRDLVPHLRELADRMKGRPFAVLGVGGDAERDELKQYMTRERINWRSWWDDGTSIWPTHGPIWTRWAIAGSPTIFVLDHRGVIRYKEIAENQLDAAVEVLLKERESAGPGKADVRR